VADGIVVFAPPGDDAAQVVKRVVAVAGDRVETREGRLYVNGRLASPPQGEGAATEDLDDQVWTIGPDQLFLAGDNRPNSRDSRFYGPVAVGRVQGRIVRKIADAPR
jgi:signal peptidase I